ncbi:MAG: hypothetical protein ACOX3G_00045 [Armatimonadota bacterium]
MKWKKHPDTLDPAIGDDHLVFCKLASTLAGHADVICGVLR